MKKFVILLAALLALAGCIEGEKGDTGPMGPQGPQGPQGIQGPVGPAGTYTAGDGIDITASVLSVDYGGNGTSTQAARSDHTHSSTADVQTYVFTGTGPVQLLLPDSSTGVPVQDNSVIRYKAWVVQTEPPVCNTLSYVEHGTFEKVGPSAAARPTPLTIVDEWDQTGGVAWVQVYYVSGEIRCAAGGVGSNAETKVVLEIVELLF